MRRNGSIITVRGEVLHCKTYRNTLRSGQILLIDAGRETADGYARDITRCFPVSGRFDSFREGGLLRRAPRAGGGNPDVPAWNPVSGCAPGCLPLARGVPRRNSSCSGGIRRIWWSRGRTPWWPLPHGDWPPAWPGRA